MVALCLTAALHSQVRPFSAILESSLSLPHLLSPGHDSATNVVLLYFKSGKRRGAGARLCSLSSSPAIGVPLFPEQIARAAAHMGSVSALGVGGKEMLFCSGRKRFSNC